MTRTRYPYVAVAVAGALLTGCSSPEPISDAGPGDPLTKTFEEGARPAAPDLAGTTLEGDDVRLSDYRGKVVVLNAWASWCGPCRLEAPELRKVQQTWGGRGLRILGLDNEGSRARGLAFHQRFQLTYPSLYDPSGKQAQRLPHGLVNTQSLPFTVVVDRTGKVAATRMGPVTEAQLSKVVAPLLGPQP